MVSLRSFAVQVSIPDMEVHGLADLVSGAGPDAFVRIGSMVFRAYVTAVSVSGGGDTRIDLMCTGAPGQL